MYLVAREPQARAEPVVAPAETEVFMSAARIRALCYTSSLTETVTFFTNSQDYYVLRRVKGTRQDAHKPNTRLSRILKEVERGVVFCHRVCLLCCVVWRFPAPLYQGTMCPPPNPCKVSGVGL